MPFNVDNPPDKIKSLSSKKQRQWVEVFNSCWKKHHDDAKCHAMAWGVAKKASVEDEEDVGHNDKYECPGCGLMAAAREILQVGLDLQDVEPRIASALIAGSREMMSHVDAGR